jgi:hypothetical protein
MEPGDDLVERVLRDALGGRNSNTQVITVKDESKSNRAWNAFYLMLGLNVALLAIVVNHERKIDDLTHYLNAIYMAAPHLKPPEKT